MPVLQVAEALLWSPQREADGGAVKSGRGRAKSEGSVAVGKSVLRRWKRRAAVSVGSGNPGNGVLRRWKRCADSWTSSRTGRPRALRYAYAPRHVVRAVRDPGSVAAGGELEGQEGLHPGVHQGGVHSERASERARGGRKRRAGESEGKARENLRRDRALCRRCVCALGGFVRIGAGGSE
eukprot:2085342-Rhodomonas_salina.1